LYFMKI